MKVTSGILGSHFGARLLWIALLVSLALGITLALLLTRGSATADGQDEFTAPIVLEEIRPPPKVVEPPSVREQRQVQGNGASITQQKPTTSELVTNLGQSPIAPNSFDNDYAQAFTTGGHSDGYTLTSVKLDLHTTGNQPSYSMAIHEDSSGAPDSSLGTLSGGTSLNSTITTETFTASGNGIDLDASTTYWVVMDVGSSNTNAKVSVTNTNAEDGGGAAGWTIANDRLVRTVSATAWVTTNTRPAEFRLAVEGYAKPPALISNSGKSFDGYVEKAGAHAQSFTTGSNSGGYTLTSVRVRVQPFSTPVPSNYSVSVRTNSRSGEPGITLGTLTKSGSLSPVNAWTLVDFPVSGDGIDLVANTRYWLVSSANSTVRIAITIDPDEDPGGAAGWSIGNENSFEFKNSSWVGGTQGKLQFVVRGYAINRLSQQPRDPIIVNYTNAQGTPEAVEITAASSDRDTLWQYFYDSCQSQRSVTTVHDYSWRNADGHLMQARNGWKYVEVMDDDGNVTGTKAQTVTECANHGMYLRQSNCANPDWLARNPHLHEAICPTYRTW